jgi:hypothetical protein
MAGSGSSAPAFAPGDVVVVKGYGRAEFLEGPHTDPDHEHHGRCLVRYADSGSTYQVRPELLRKAWQVRCQARPEGGAVSALGYRNSMEQGTKRVVVCKTTPEYRAAVVNCTEPTDVCLEIGCHEGLFLATRQQYITVHISQMGAARPQPIHHHACTRLPWALRPTFCVLRAPVKHASTIDPSSMTEFGTTCMLDVKSTNTTAYHTP